MCVRICAVFAILLFFGNELVAQSFSISGNINPVEGSTETYALSGNIAPGNYNVSIIGGMVTASNLNPSNGQLYIQVRWNFLQSSGEIRILNGRAVVYNQRIQILSFESQAFCQNAMPLSQYVNYGTTGSRITVSNCRLTSFPGYYISYLWEVADVTDPSGPPTWNAIGRQDQSYLDPPPMFQYGVKAYRRAILFFDQAGTTLLRRQYTNQVLVRFLGPFDPGKIADQGAGEANSDNPVLINYNAEPLITATAATGGLCFSYQYTWERSLEDEPWETIGTGEEYPANIPIRMNCRIRRKAECNGQILYSNSLAYIVNYSSPSAENLNYIRINSIWKSGISGWEEADQLSIGEKQQSTIYFDGLGRRVQTVDKELSELENGNWADLVSCFSYDPDGRDNFSYIPYASSTAIGKFKTNAIADQQSFVRNKFNEPVNAPTFDQTIYEPDPLNRASNIKAAGAGWSGDPLYAGLSIAYDFNREEEQIRIWDISFAQGAIPFSISVYPAASLARGVIIDEKNRKICSYYDKQGRIILKKLQNTNPGQPLDENSYTGWLSTYYVYDDLGNLRAVITPKAVSFLANNSWKFSNEEVYRELCFYNEYDARQRLIVRHSPGSGEIKMVYDIKDRLVLRQDANQRDRQWSFYLYDNSDRQIVSGLFDQVANRDAMAATVQANHNGNTSITLFTGTNEQVVADNPVVGQLSYCNNCSSVLVNTVNYYNDYNYPGSMNFDKKFSFASPGPAIEEDMNMSLRTTDFITGEKKRVIDNRSDDGDPLNDLFLTGTFFYDNKGRILQHQSSNLKSGVNCMTWQHDFCGKLLSKLLRHNMPGSPFIDFIVRSNYEYDKAGRLKLLTKAYGTAALKKLASYRYDEYGRMKEKILSPDYNSGRGLESLKYDYNIQGWLTGINRQYALSNTSLAQWDHFFGEYLGYENRDQKFASSQYDGTLAGVIWKTQGNGIPQMYSYSYDPVNRLTGAAFSQKEKPEDANWANNTTDYSASGMQYDENNNLVQMDQKGLIPGVDHPLFIDRLQYEYQSAGAAQWSNKLLHVFDQTTDLTSTTNGIAGDFKDETYAVNSDDYNYDANGNRLADKNKKIVNGADRGIVYNFMNKPQKIHLPDNAVMEFIYDATGNLLGKKITAVAGESPAATWFDGNFIYEEKNGQQQLKMILHEEGRLRVYKPVSNPRLIISSNIALPGGNEAACDFFIKDHLQSLRMVITEEDHTEMNDCSMETANPSVQQYENAIFGESELNNSRRDRAGPNGIAPGWNSNTSAKISMLKQGAQCLGPNAFLKVMAGDLVSTQTSYYWTGAVDNTNANSSFLNTIIAGIVTSVVNSPQAAAIKTSANGISTGYSQNAGGLGSFIAGYNDPSSARPLAFLNVLFFDESFRFIPHNNITGAGSFALQVGNDGDGQPPLVILHARVPENGYVYVYLSNNSRTPVYFDDFKITHQRGKIVEENSYYPFGLKIKSLCARAFEKGDNFYRYEGSYSVDEEKTGWNEFDLRMYDAQIGSWLSADPVGQFASQYIGMGSNPVNFTDPSGGNIGDAIGAALSDNWLGTAVGAVSGASIGFLSGKGERSRFSNAFKGFIGGAVLGNLVQSGSFDLWEAAADIHSVTQMMSNTSVTGLRSAWEITNEWNSDFINQFCSSVIGYMNKMEIADQRFTCDDLALELIIRFASDNHLPFRWEVDAVTYDAAATSAEDLSDFILHVKEHSGAPDFRRPANTVETDVDAVTGGSMILNVNGSQRTHHVQIITAVYRELGTVRGLNVKQGNFRKPVWKWNRFTGSDNPESWRYLGVRIQTGYYNSELDIFRNFTENRTTMDFSQTQKLIFVKFNFLNWNTN
jgi:RHS repeat-associated protein